MKRNLKKIFWNGWTRAKTLLSHREVIYGAIIIVFLIVMIFFLSAIPAKSALNEINTANQSRTLSQIAENPLWLPYRGLSFIILQLSNSIRSLRAISIVFFGLSILALYRILKRWHSDRVALFSSAMYATNATALAVGRLATPLVLLFGWSLIISLLLWLQHGNSRRVAPFTLASFSAGLLYVPGAPYFFILLILLFGSKFKVLFGSMTRTAYYVSVGAVFLVIAPLIISFIQDVNVLKLWLLLPQHMDWGAVPRNILNVPSAFLYRTPINPLLGVGQLPIFDVASGGLFLLGVYSYRKHLKLNRTKVMILTALLSVIVGALGQLMFAVVILLPFIYAVIASGICFILDQWYVVFPKNPVARWFGVGLISLVVFSSVYYQLTRAVVVWQHTPETRAVYSQPRLIQ